MYQSVFYFGHAELAVPSHSDPLWWEKIGKVANQAKLAIPSHSEPLQWENIGLAIPSHSEPLWWEKIRKVVNQAKLVILSHFGGKRLEKLQHRQNPTFPGGVHQPEPQCHVDPKFQLNLKNRCFLFSVFHKQGSHRAYGTAVHVEV